MVPDDLKYLPACEVKTILEGAKKRSQTLAASPRSDGYEEEGVGDQIPKVTTDRVKQNVALAVPTEGGYIAEFAKITLKAHDQLCKEYQISSLQQKCEEHGSMYGKSANEISASVAE